MDLVDRIEKRRFVGREFLLWLWFESEVFDATLQTREHGEIGLWLESRLTLSHAKESTRIIAPMPGLGPEAKAALRRGQLPESAGLRIYYKEAETRFSLHAERLAITGLKLNTVLDEQDEAEEPSPLLEELKGNPSRGRNRKGQEREAQEDRDDEVFYERMRLTAEIEDVLSGLYRDFVVLRLSNAWSQHVVPALHQFARGETVDADAYRAKVTKAGHGGKKSARGA
jgi:hypothetical protein